MTSSGSAAGGVGLDGELRSLAASLAMPAVDDQLVGAVLARLDREPVPETPSSLRRAGAALETLGVWLQNRWRTVSVALGLTAARAGPAATAGPAAGAQPWMLAGLVLGIVTAATAIRYLPAARRRLLLEPAGADDEPVRMTKLPSKEIGGPSFVGSD